MSLPEALGEAVVTDESVVIEEVGEVVATGEALVTGEVVVMLNSDTGSSGFCTVS